MNIILYFSLCCAYSPRGIIVLVYATRIIFLLVAPVFEPNWQQIGMARTIVRVYATRAKETDSRGRTVAKRKASDGVRHAGARSGVGRRVTERYETKVIRLYRWVQVFFLLQEHSKHPREMVITPKASTSGLLLLSIVYDAGSPSAIVVESYTCLSFKFGSSQLRICI